MSIFNPDPNPSYVCVFFFPLSQRLAFRQKLIVLLMTNPDNLLLYCTCILFSVCYEFLLLLLFSMNLEINILIFIFSQPLDLYNFNNPLVCNSQLRFFLSGKIVCLKCWRIHLQVSQSLITCSSCCWLGIQVLERVPFCWVSPPTPLKISLQQLVSAEFTDITLYNSNGLELNSAIVSFPFQVHS